MNSKADIKEIFKKTSELINDLNNEIRTLNMDDWKKRAGKAERQFKKLEDTLQSYNFNREDDKLANRLRSALTDMRRAYKNEALGRRALSQVFITSAERKIKRLEQDYKNK